MNCKCSSTLKSLCIRIQAANIREARFWDCNFVLESVSPPLLGNFLHAATLKDREQLRYRLISSEMY